MTQEEAIRIIKIVLAVAEDFEIIVQGEEFTEEKCKEAVGAVIKALEQTRWIPASERLPKACEYIGDVDKYYLVQNEYGDMLVARYTHSEYWEQIYQFQPIGDEIVAWRELPRPYKAEREE